MITWIRDLFVAWVDRPDRGLEEVRAKFGTKPVRPEWRRYDFELARKGAEKARRHTETGRPIKQPKPLKVSKSQPIPFARSAKR